MKPMHLSIRPQERKNIAGDDLVIVDDGNDDQESAIVFTLGNVDTDYPDDWIRNFAEWAVAVLNRELTLIHDGGNPFERFMLNQ